MYRVETVGEDIDAVIEALSPDFLTAFAEVRAALELSPWSVGQPYVAANPSGSRTVAFGPGARGMALYAVEDRQHLVLIWQLSVFPE